jgi:hypothetical protein
MDTEKSISSQALPNPLNGVGPLVASTLLNLPMKYSSEAPPIFSSQLTNQGCNIERLDACIWSWSFH